ncbi:MAG: murein biosynthesis integral membrane protein MurJ [Candidatus Uhrbacteria bacterium]
MILKLFNGQSKTIASAAAIVAFMSFVSRIVGLLRDRILAGEFGAGDMLDTYYAAFKVPDFIFAVLVTGAISASFIPLFTKRLVSFKGHQAAWKLTNNVVNMIGLAFIVIALVGVLFSGSLSQLVAPGFGPAKQEMVASFMRVMFLSNLVLGVSTVLSSVLQGLKRFFIYSLAPVMYNVGIIAGVIWFVDWFGPIGLAWGVVFGALLHLLTQLVGAMQAGYRYRWNFNLADKDTREIGKLMLPRALGLGIWQINFIIMTVIASTLAAGSVAIFQFAFNLEYFAIGIFGVSFAIAAFPDLSRFVESKSYDKFTETFSTTARQVLFFIVPASLLFLILRAQIVRVVLGAGNFSWEDTILTADVLAFFTLSFFAQALIFLLVRGYFAFHDTMTPLYTGIASALVNVFAALALTKEYGVVGLGMAYSLWAVVNMALLWIPLRTRVGSLGEGKILNSMLRITPAAVAAAIVMQAMKPVVVKFITLDTFWGVLTQGLIAGGLGLIVYALIAWLLRSPEMHELVAGLRLRLLKKAKPEESAGEATGV